MFTYKVKASIKYDANNFGVLNSKLMSTFKNAGLIDAGNCEYGTDSFSKGMSVIQYLGGSDWFMENAKELKWFNGEEFEQTKDYVEEDALSFFMTKRAKQ